MKKVIDQKSDFLGRAKPNRCFEKMKVLSDGSYLSKIYASANDRLRDRNGTVVRVIEYTLDDPERVGHGELHRLVTTLVDEHEHPAETLMSVGKRKWQLMKPRPICETHQHFAAIVQRVYCKKCTVC